MSQGRPKGYRRDYYDGMKTPAVIECATVKQYIAFKTDVLVKDFFIDLTADEEYRLSICDSFEEVNRVCRDIINRRW